MEEPWDARHPREVDVLEQELVAREDAIRNAQDTKRREELAQQAQANITVEDKKRALEEWKVEQDVERQKAERDAKRHKAEDSFSAEGAQGRVHRHFSHGPFALYLKMNEYLDTYFDEFFVWPSTDEEEERWVWQFLPSKGSVTLHHPSGQMVCEGGWIKEIWLQHWLKRWTEPWLGDIPLKPGLPPSEEAQAYEQYEELSGMRRIYGGTPLEFQDALDLKKGDERSTLQEQEAKAPGTMYWLWRHPKMKGAMYLTTPGGEVRVQGNFLQQAAFFILLKDFTQPYTPDEPPPPKPNDPESDESDESDGDVPSITPSTSATSAPCPTSAPPSFPAPPPDMPPPSFPPPPDFPPPPNCPPPPEKFPPPPAFPPPPSFPPPPMAPPPPFPPPPFAVGDVIRIQHLKNKAHYNGQLGTVVCVREREKKVDVRLRRSGHVIRLKDANLRIHEDVPRDRRVVEDPRPESAQPANVVDKADKGIVEANHTTGALKGESAAQQPTKDLGSDTGEADTGQGEEDEGENDGKMDNGESEGDLGQDKRGGPEGDGEMGQGEEDAGEGDGKMDDEGQNERKVEGMHDEGGDDDVAGDATDGAAPGDSERQSTGDRNVGLDGAEASDENICTSPHDGTEVAQADRDVEMAGEVDPPEVTHDDKAEKGGDDADMADKRGGPEGDGEMGQGEEDAGEGDGKMDDEGQNERKVEGMHDEGGDDDVAGDATDGAAPGDSERQSTGDRNVGLDGAEASDENICTSPHDGTEVAQADRDVEMAGEVDPPEVTHDDKAEKGGDDADMAENPTDGEGVSRDV